MTVIHLAIYQTDVFTLMIEYELIDGDAIAISNVDIQARPITEFEQRERSRGNYPNRSTKNRGYIRLTEEMRLIAPFADSP